MQDLKLTLVQADQIWEDKNANFKNYERLLTGIESDLIILPEMFQTGFSMNTEHLSEAFSASESIAWLQQMAKKLNAAFYTSLMIKEGDNVFNRGVFVQPDGQVLHYDKRKTFSLAGEDKFIQRGNKETIVDYKNWKIQLQVCYDLRFPEIVRNRIESNQKPAYDLILYVANWPEKRALHWSSLLKARAIENQCYVVGVNRVGIDNNTFSYSGNSMIVNALGKCEELTPHKEHIKTVALNFEELNELRETLPFLIDR
ncbi:MAG: nitrilase family protein [Crocinitomicaceae bacterium]|nr:nitrilase family protein [Crocinitomicaceae bacterium]